MGKSSNKSFHEWMHLVLQKYFCVAKPSAAQNRKVLKAVSAICWFQAMLCFCRVCSFSFFLMVSCGAFFLHRCGLIKTGFLMASSQGNGLLWFSSGVFGIMLFFLSLSGVLWLLMPKWNFSWHKLTDKPEKQPEKLLLLTLFPAGNCADFMNGEKFLRACYSSLGGVSA